VFHTKELKLDFTRFLAATTEQIQSENESKKAANEKSKQKAVNEKAKQKDQTKRERSKLKLHNHHNQHNQYK
jgi:hypothetical protein